MKFFFRCIAVALVFAVAGYLARLSRMTNISSEVFVPPAILELSPSVKSPLVISVCESPNGYNSDDSLGLTDEDTDFTYTNRLRASWARQRSQMTAMFKTLLYFSKAPIWRIIVLTDTLDTFHRVVNITSAFPRRHKERLRFERREQWFPPGYTAIINNWRPCAWAKQFLAESLPEEDAVVFIDTDLIFLGPAEELWQVLESMTPPRAVALAPEPNYLTESPPRDYAGTAGINTGVMIANLTRLRQLPGGGLGSAIIAEGAIHPLPRHDQDALNHFLKPKPHLMLELTSRWNFLPSACMTRGSPCPDCVSSGILALHGADMTFFRFIDVKFKVCLSMIYIVSTSIYRSVYLSTHTPTHTYTHTRVCHVYLLTEAHTRCCGVDETWPSLYSSSRVFHLSALHAVLPHPLSSHSSSSSPRPPLLPFLLFFLPRPPSRGGTGLASAEDFLPLPPLHSSRRASATSLASFAVPDPRRPCPHIASPHYAWLSLAVAWAVTFAGARAPPLSCVSACPTF